MGDTPGRRIRVKDLDIVPGSRQVLRNGEEIALTGRTFDFLIALVNAAPDIASPDDLAEAVWDGRPVSPETINQRAKLLRDALGDDSHSPRYFTAVRGQGYRLLVLPEKVGAEPLRFVPLRPPWGGRAQPCEVDRNRSATGYGAFRAGRAVPGHRTPGTGHRSLSASAGTEPVFHATGP